MSGGSDDPDRGGIPSHPTLNPAFVPIRIDSNRIQFRAGPWGGPTHTVVDDDGSIVDRLPELLDGSSSIGEFLDAVEADPEQVRNLIRGLAKKGVIRDGRDLDATANALAVEPGFTQEDFESARESTVLVAGNGTIAETLRTDLAAVDIPVVSADGTRERDLEAQAECADLIVYCSCTYRPSQVDTFNRLALETDTPLVATHCIGVDGIVGPTVLPGETCCLRCFRERVDTLDAFTSAEASPAVVPAYGRVLAGYLTIDVLHRLVYGVAFTAGRIVRFDFRTLSVDTEEVLRLPECPVCSTFDELPSHQPLVSIDRLVEDIQEL